MTSSRTGDVLVTVAVLAALVALRLRLAALDLVVAFGLGGFIVWNAWRIVARNLQVLADAAAVRAEIADVYDVLVHVEPDEKVEHAED